MALTTEQQAQIEYEKAMESARTEARMAERSKEHKLEALRVAQSVVLENYRNADAGAPDITAEQITTFAASLTAFVDTDA